MVYVISDGTYLKIGRTRYIEQRLNDLQTSNPRKLKVIKAFETPSEADDAFLESCLHRRFSENRIVHGQRTTEWFKKCILDDVDSAVKEITKNASFTYFESYMCGADNDHLHGEPFKKYRLLLKRYRMLQCENQELLRRLSQIPYGGVNVRTTSDRKLFVERENALESIKKLICEKEELSKENRNIIQQRNDLLAENAKLVREKRETAVKKDSESDAIEILNLYPELLTKRDLEKVFGKPFYEIIDWAASVGAEVVDGFNYFYDRDAMIEALKGGNKP